MSVPLTLLPERETIQISQPSGWGSVRKTELKLNNNEANLKEYDSKTESENIEKTKPGGEKNQAHTVDIYQQKYRNVLINHVQPVYGEKSTN